MTTAATVSNPPRRADRLRGVDAARGLALLGMFTAHLTNVDQILDWGSPGTWWAITAGRSSVLFAVLAGVSLALVSGRDHPVTGPALTVARRRIAVRGVLVALVGFALIQLQTPVAVILPTYGILFVLLLPALSWRRVALLCTAGGLAVVALPLLLLFLPQLSTAGATTQQVLLYYPLPTFAAYLLVGLAVGRSRLSTRRTLAWLAGGGTALAIGVYSAGEAVSPGGAFFYGEGASRLRDLVFASEPHSSTLVDMLGSLGVALGVIGVCGLLAGEAGPHPRAAQDPPSVGVPATERGARPGQAARDAGRAAAGVPLRLLAAIGAMPLTVYSAHLLVLAVLYHSGFLDTLGPAGEAGVLIAFAAGSCALGLAFRGSSGPLERAVGAIARRVGGRLPA